MIKNGWYGLPQEQTTKVTQYYDTIVALVEVISHEFFGQAPMDTEHYAVYLCLKEFII